MRRTVACMLLVATVGAAERNESEIEFDLPGVHAWRLDAVVVPGAGGAVVRGERGEGAVALLLRIDATGGDVLARDADAPHAVTVKAFRDGAGGWTAAITVVDEATGDVRYAGTRPLEGRPTRLRVRAGSVLKAETS